MSIPMFILRNFRKFSPNILFTRDCSFGQQAPSQSNRIFYNTWCICMDLALNLKYFLNFISLFPLSHQNVYIYVNFGLFI